MYILKPRSISVKIFEINLQYNASGFVSFARRILYSNFSNIYHQPQSIAPYLNQYSRIISNNFTVKGFIKYFLCTHSWTIRSLFDLMQTKSVVYSHSSNETLHRISSISSFFCNISAYAYWIGSYDLKISLHLPAFLFSHRPLKPFLRIKHLSFWTFRFWFPNCSSEYSKKFQLRVFPKSNFPKIHFYGFSISHKKTLKDAPSRPSLLSLVEDKPLCLKEDKEVYLMTFLLFPLSYIIYFWYPEMWIWGRTISI